MEIAFTAVADFLAHPDVRLTGHSYLWMFPIYGLVPFLLGAAWPRLERLALPLRLALYVAVLLAGEFVAGTILHACLGQCPWEPGYRQSRWAIMGVTRLDYAPFWVLPCWVFERLYVVLHPVRSRGSGRSPG
jgi:hypothetical protein